MMAWRVHEFGDFRDHIALESVEAPRIDENLVAVRVRSAGINNPDILMVEGRYQVLPPRPFIPGFEAAGEVVAVKEGGRFQIGDRVLCWLGRVRSVNMLACRRTTSYQSRRGCPITKRGLFSSFTTRHSLHYSIGSNWLPARRSLFMPGRVASVLPPSSWQKPAAPW